MAKKKYEHAGHRKRLRDEFCERGFEGWSEDVILEYMLFCAIPRSDTHALSKRLIKECGTLKGVLTAPVKVLENIEGMGKKSAAFIKTLNEFVHYYNGIKTNGKVYLTPALMEPYFIDLFKSHRRECLYAVCIDARGAVIDKELISEGAFDSSEIDIGKIVRAAIRSDAAGVVLAHNHPGGRLEPSGADIIATQMVKSALRVVGVALNEHVIVTDEGVRGFISAIKDIETEKNIQKYTRNG